ncbi:unnamed protein product [Symbiodinium natans]|uniref:Uncharacterized protein n=1 Tax=Symbiodinium natans TaxID=878477 RepID=A0A812RUH9_9DINO|nr:unnamed protein product [Symbiodinium natans]
MAQMEESLEQQAAHITTLEFDSAPAPKKPSLAVLAAPASKAAAQTPENHAGASKNPVLLGVSQACEKVYAGAKALSKANDTIQQLQETLSSEREARSMQEKDASAKIQELTEKIATWERKHAAALEDLKQNATIQRLQHAVSAGDAARENLSKAAPPKKSTAAPPPAKHPTDAAPKAPPKAPPKGPEAAIPKPPPKKAAAPPAEVVPKAAESWPLVLGQRATRWCDCSDDEDEPSISVLLAREKARMPHRFAAECDKEEQGQQMRAALRMASSVEELERAIAYAEELGLKHEASLGRKKLQRLQS